MTLVLTKPTSQGVAMVADSAATIRTSDGGIEKREGRQKLYHAPEIPVVISVWGGFEGGDSIVEFTSEFVEGVDTGSTVGELAERLKSAVRARADPIDISDHPLGTLGFHVAGFEAIDDEPVPTVYHVHNGRSTRLEEMNPSRAERMDWSLVNVIQDIPPELVMLEYNRSPILRNGDFQLYVDFLERAIEPMIQAVNGDTDQFADITIPSGAELETLVEYLVFQIQLMTALDRVSTMEHDGEGRSRIGGEVQTVQFDLEGTLTERTYDNPGIRRTGGSG